MFYVSEVGEKKMNGWVWRLIWMGDGDGRVAGIRYDAIQWFLGDVCTKRARACAFFAASELASG